MAFSLEAIFKIDATGVKTGLKQARAEMNSFAEDAVKLGAGLAIAGFVSLSKSAIDLASHLSDTAQNIGINVEALQALYAQAQKNGVAQEQMDKALEKTKAAVIGAAQGNKQYADALAVLHLRGSALLDLPLDRQYVAIAHATTQAEDKAQAYAAVSTLLGEKVGPKLMSSLKELGEEGFDKVMKSAKDAGQVMSAETIVALDRAGDAIDDFKKKATVAVGNIIVDFRTEDGLKLLGLKLMKVASQFGGTILDFFTEAGGMAYAVLKGAFLGSLNFLRDGFINVIELAATQVNKILPKQFQIEISNLDKLKSDGKSVSDSITDAIANTSPSTFKKDFSGFWQDAIDEQQKLVDHVNAIDLGPEAKKLTAAGEKVKTNLSDGAKPVAAAVEPIVESAMKFQNVADTFKNVASEFMTAATTFSGAASKMSHTGLDYQDQSTTALEGVVERLRNEFSKAAMDTSGQSAFSPNGHTATYYALQSELFNAQKELSQRQEVASYISRYGEAAATRQYGDTLVQRANDAINAGQQQTNTLLTSIDQHLGNFLKT